MKPGATAADVKGMKVEEAKAIYRSKYWAAQRCDELPAGVDYAVFDNGVNSGIGRSGRVLGLSDSDWRTGDEVLAALAKRDAAKVIVAIFDERLRFLRSLKTWGVFGKGWSTRVAELKAYALQLAAGAPHETTAPTPAAGKGFVPTAKAAQQSSAGAVIAAGAAAAQQAHQSGASGGAVAVIVVAAIAAAIGAYAFWHWRAQRQQQKPA